MVPELMLVTGDDGDLGCMISYVIVMHVYVLYRMCMFMCLCMCVSVKISSSDMQKLRLVTATKESS